MNRAPTRARRGKAERGEGGGERVWMSWCGKRDSNPHSPFGPRDFKSLASTGFAIPACEGRGAQVTRLGFT